MKRIWIAASVVVVAASLGVGALVFHEIRPSAMAVCSTLAAEGIVRNCHPEQPSGLNSAAKEKVSFELVSSSGPGRVLKFESDEYLDRVVKSYAEFEGISGRHRFPLPGLRLFIVLGPKASDADAAKTRAVLEDL